MMPLYFSEQTEARLSGLAIFCAMLFLYAFGVHGFLRSDGLGADFLIFHKAAVLFLDGHNPWLLMKDSEAPFSYPPQFFSFLVFYGIFPSKIALGIHTLVNLISVGVLIFFANRWFTRITQPTSVRLVQALPLALIIGNPFTAHIVYEGQVTLPSCAAAILSWHFLRDKKLILSGIFLGLASIKPQVAFFYILWLALRLEFKVLFCGGLCALVLMLPALIGLGPLESFQSWFASMEGYGSVPMNQPGSPHVVGLESFFVALGIKGSGLILKLLSVICLITLFIYRRYFDHVLILNAFFLLPLTFIFGHDTGYAAVIMLWSYLVFLALQSKSTWQIATATALCLGFFFPQRFLREIDFAALHHTRTFIVIMAYYFCFRWSNSVIQEKAIKNSV